jgi:hypothetical protein
MKNEQVRLLLYLLDEAFGNWESEETRERQSFLANLKTVSEKSWWWVPQGGERSIYDITLHVGSCKYMYDNHAFGDGKLSWDNPVLAPWRNTKPELDEVVRWLEQGHNLLKKHISELEDVELVKFRKTNWGEIKETRWIIKVMIEHDLYHAGEVNHIRSIYQKDDSWAYNKRK